MMKRQLFPAFAAVLIATLTSARAGYLFADPENFPIPEFYNTAEKHEYSEWDKFYAPHTAGNYPDRGAPHGGAWNGQNWVPVTRTAANFPSNPVYSPSNPLAFWDEKNPTITQFNTTAIITGGSTNIYTFSGPTSFSLKDSTADATSPYKLGTVMFQFQTDGKLIDFSSIKLRYRDGNNVLQELSPTEYLREFLGTASAQPEAANAFANRVALQWDLTGLNIDTYEIVFSSEFSSMSFQKAVLDTADSYGIGVPASRMWTGVAGNWSNGGNWQQGTSSVANGNVKFGNSAAATVSLDGNRTIGEMIFQTGADVTINRPGSQTLTSNTGISTTAAATGTYTVNTPWALGATNIFELAAGTVRLNGVVSGGYGLLKKGAGTLVLGANNTFTGGVTVQGGMLRIEGTNNYSGGTAILKGRVEVAANSPLGAAGALGRSTDVITLGSDAALFPTDGGAAALWIDGDRTIGQSFKLAFGGFEKRIGAMDTTAGAVLSGAVNFGTAAASANNVRFSTKTAGDRLTFTGAMTNGAAASTLTIDGPGTVVLGGGTAKSFANATTVSSGALEVANGTTFNGVGNWTVNSGAKLRVNGSFAGNGTLSVNGTLTGSGTVSKSVNLNAGRVAPGVNVGSLTMVGAQTWSGGGGYEWQVNDADGAAGAGFDLLQITGSLNVAATSGGRFTIYVSSVGLDGLAGLAGDFDPSLADQWLLVTASGGITGFAANDFLVDASAFLNAPDGKFSVSQQGNSLFLNYAPVPEAGTWALLLLGTGCLLFIRRRAINR